ncbi:MAG: putative cysteine desulfurase [Alphaproteobacteria bacterium ADurb.BinA280]|nr:MAG: putative cysteine desulfurase [Alphaproteobacteria bacterium ADurb.BinA280]
MNTATDWTALRDDFPILRQQVHGKPLVYLDSANTGQKPQVVIDAVDAYYRDYCANVSRAVHALGERATAMYEGTRETLARFLNVHRDELVFTSGTTNAINLVAYSWLLPRLRAGDVVLVSRMEHHANLVPWQMMCERTGAQLLPVELTPQGEIDLDDLRAKLGPQVKLLAMTHVSNVLGTITPICEICSMARKHGVATLVDGSQAIPHMPVDIASIGCDFYAFTGHKVCGPTGTGALWAKREHLQSMPPFFGGGEMIREVSFERTSFNDPPHKFEAGTPNIAGFIGLGAAVDYLSGIGMATIAEREQFLLREATARLRDVPGLRIFGAASHKAAVISFAIDGAHAHDLATLLDLDGVAVRSGQHCAHPLLQWLGVGATLRASLAFFNTLDEIDILVRALHKARQLLA